MTVPRATVRPARRTDLPEVAAVYGHHALHGVATFDEAPRPLAEWERKYDDLLARGLPFLVTEEAGRVTGFAHAGPYRPKPAYRYTVEDSLYLAPDATGRGLGAALLGALLDACGHAGARRVVAVITDPGGEASVALHRRFGFTEAGRLTAVGYKHGRWLDTLLFQREL
ncbi:MULTISPECIES: N-acetyltransferase family protein [unclassified Streptomyces]|uniref:GNAT family N-acetyltransferase n=1 Tax=unclassified Streptomyces TaxID=2593676 RepID=UPI0033B64A56